MNGFVEFSWPINAAGEAEPSFKAVKQLLNEKQAHFEAYLARDYKVDRRVLRVLVDHSHAGEGGITAEEIRKVVERASSTHEFHGTVDVRYEIEAAHIHSDSGDPIGIAPPPPESHRWWHRW